MMTQTIVHRAASVVFGNGVNAVVVWGTAATLQTVMVVTILRAKSGTAHSKTAVSVPVAAVYHSDRIINAKF